MRLVTQRLVVFFVALAVVALGGRAALAQDDPAADAGPAGRPPLGSAVPFIGDEGGEIALITVTDFVDPFEDYDPSSAPERGNHYVLVELQVENVSPRPFPFQTYSVSLQDAEGFLYTQAFVFRTTEDTEARPDFPADEIPADDTVTGVITFSVFNNADIVRVIYNDGFQRLVFLADLTVEPVIDLDDDGAATAEATEESDGEATEEATDVDATEEVEDETGVEIPDLSEDECEDVAVWYEDGQARLDALDEPVAALSASDPDPEDLRDAVDQLEEAAEEQADVDVPEAAQAANDAGIALLEVFAAELDNYADLVESGDATEDDQLAVYTATQPLVTEFEDLTGALEIACDLDPA